jgi:hypothetical protein
VGRRWPDRTRRGALGRGGRIPPAGATWPHAHRRGGASLPDTAGSESESEIAWKLHNSVADLISVPFQNNTNFRSGPRLPRRFRAGPFHLDAL